MCLLKVYLEEGNERTLIAEDVALIVHEGDGFKLLGLDLKGEAVLEKVKVCLVDTLNSIMVFKPKN
jgi:predicted RNA-binding protein